MLLPTHSHFYWSNWWADNCNRRSKESNASHHSHVDMEGHNDFYPYLPLSTTERSMLQTGPMTTWQLHGDLCPTPLHFFLTLCCPNGNFPMGNLGRFPQGKPAATVTLPKVHAKSFCVSVIHQILKWTTYRIFTVRAWSLLFVHIYTRRLGKPTTGQHNILTRKNSHKFFLCSWQGLNLGSWDLKSDALPTESPHQFKHHKMIHEHCT